MGCKRMSESVINEPIVNQAARIFNHLRSIYLSQQTVAVLGIFDEGLGVISLDCRSK